MNENCNSKTCRQQWFSVTKQHKASSKPLRDSTHKTLHTMLWHSWWCLFQQSPKPMMKCGSFGNLQCHCLTCALHNIGCSETTLMHSLFTYWQQHANTILIKQRRNETHTHIYIGLKKITINDLNYTIKLHNTINISATVKFNFSLTNRFISGQAKCSKMSFTN